MTGVFVVVGEPSQEVMSAMDRQLHEYTMRAARGEHGWICSSCCMSFGGGMPDECGCGNAECTAIIKRDKEEARK
jgi:hypothetical protein